MTLALIALTFSACNSDELTNSPARHNGAIQFSAGMATKSISGKAPAGHVDREMLNGSEQLEQPLYIYTSESDFEIEGAQTRALKENTTVSDISTFGVLGYKNGALEFEDSYDLPKKKWVNQTRYLSGKGDDSYEFFAMTSLQGEGTVPTLAKSFSYSVGSTPDKALDLIAGKATASGDREDDVDLAFRHILTGIRFKASEELIEHSSIEKVEFFGVKTSGTYSFETGRWSGQGNAIDYEVKPVGVVGGKNNYTTPENELTCMMMPQTFGEDAYINVTYIFYDQTINLRLSLNGKTWEPGKVMTYFITPRDVVAIQNSLNIYGVGWFDPSIQDYTLTIRDAETEAVVEEDVIFLRGIFIPEDYYHFYMDDEGKDFLITAGITTLDDFENAGYADGKIHTFALDFESPSTHAGFRAYVDYSLDVMRIEVNVAAGETVTLPFEHAAGNGEMTTGVGEPRLCIYPFGEKAPQTSAFHIYWGRDNYATASSNFNEVSLSHRYEIPGTHTITIYSNCFGDQPMTDYITPGLDGGNIPALSRVLTPLLPSAQTSLSGLFSGCSKLTSLSTDTFARFENVTDMSAIFKGCSALTSIPQHIFDKNTKVTTLSYAFSECSNLTGGIPVSIFRYNTEVEDMSYVFNLDTKLSGSIPANLFMYNTKVKDFSGVFFQCTGLTGSIPAGLFTNCPDVTSFKETFKRCSGLTGNLPETLFSNNSKVTSFEGTFYSCRNIEGTIPRMLFASCTEVTSFAQTFWNCLGFTEISTDLFKRNKKVTDFYECFFACEMVVGDVPEIWRGKDYYGSDYNLTYSEVNHRSCYFLTGMPINTPYKDYGYRMQKITNFTSIPICWRTSRDSGPSTLTFITRESYYEYQDRFTLGGLLYYADGNVRPYKSAENHDCASVWK